MTDTGDWMKENMKAIAAEKLEQEKSVTRQMLMREENTTALGNQAALERSIDLLEARVAMLEGMLHV